MTKDKYPIVSMKRLGKGKTVFVASGAEGAKRVLERLGFEKTGDACLFTAQGFSMEDCANFLYYMHWREGFWLDAEAAAVVQRYGLEVDRGRVV